MIDIIPFKIKYPLSIFQMKRVKIEDKLETELIIQRNLYYRKYYKERNTLLEKRMEIFKKLSNKVLLFLRAKHPELNPLNISLFGSSLFSENSEDFDFLVIVEGNVFLLVESILEIGGEKINVDISIKGLDNLSKGIISPKEEIHFNTQKQIIDRTAISLYRRHLPLGGYDFVNNESVFLNNILPQISDLLYHAYKKYYLGESDKELTLEQRSKKIFSRVYEALSYLILITNSNEIKELRKRAYFARESSENFNKSKLMLEESITLFHNILNNF